MRWSQLQKLIYNVWCEEIDLKISCTAYRREGASNLGRYWVQLDKRTIWEVPENLKGELKSTLPNPVASEITALLREYLDTPREELTTRDFSGDYWGIIDLMRAADRRIGKKKLLNLLSPQLSQAARWIIEARLEMPEGSAGAALKGRH